jgi:hypothetical protein
VNQPHPGVRVPNLSISPFQISLSNISAFDSTSISSKKA